MRGRDEGAYGEESGRIGSSKTVSCGAVRQSLPACWASLAGRHNRHLTALVGCCGRSYSAARCRHLVSAMSLLNLVSRSRWLKHQRYGCKYCILQVACCRRDDLACLRLPARQAMRPASRLAFADLTERPHLRDHSSRELHTETIYMQRSASVLPRFYQRARMEGPLSCHRLSGASCGWLVGKHNGAAEVKS